MNIKKIPSERGHYIIGSDKDAHNVDPIEYFSRSQTAFRATIYTDLLATKLKSLSPFDIYRFAAKKAEEEWFEELTKILKTKVPENIVAVLNAASKSDQIKLLRDQSLTPKQLTSFIVHAFQEHGYLYSTFSQEHLHNGIKESDLPRLIHLKGAEVKKVGVTKLSDGQLKHLIEFRKVVVAKFLDNGRNWHCLFLTYKSIAGKESWKNGSPHFHYISDKFGMTREQVEAELKSKFYKLNSLPHIELLDYKT